jgi:hypothetical protein
MSDKVDRIEILPAKFVEFTDDGDCIIDCLVGKGIRERRKFKNFYVGHIENPTYLFIGLSSGVGFSIIKFVDAKEYKRMFRRKWNWLNKVD